MPPVVQSSNQPVAQPRPKGMNPRDRGSKKPTAANNSAAPVHSSKPVGPINTNVSATLPAIPRCSYGLRDGCGFLGSCVLAGRFILTFGGHEQNNGSVADITCFDALSKTFIDLDQKALPTDVFGACVVAVDGITVYLCGGITNAGVLGLTFVLHYDIVDDRPVLISSNAIRLKNARYFASASVLTFADTEATPYVLMHGGVVAKAEGMSYQSTLEYLNTHTGVWQEVDATGDVPPARANHATCGHGSSLFCYGGRRDEKVFEDMYVIDLHLEEKQLQGCWRKCDVAGSIRPSLRVGHTLNVVGGRIVLVGGQRWSPSRMEAAYVWEEDKWLPCVLQHPSMQRSFHHASGVVTADGKEYLVLMGGKLDEAQEDTDQSYHAVAMLSANELQASIPTQSTSSPIQRNTSTTNLSETSLTQTSIQTTPDKGPSSTHAGHDGAPSVPIAWTRGREIGHGSFGVVYLAINSLDNTMFAVKHITCPKGMKDVEREVTMMRSLSHPNIVKYLGAEPTPDGINIFMEYVAGGALAVRLAEFYNPKSPMPLCQVQHCTRQMLEGLNYLHKRNIIHRDIKAGNVLCGPDGTLKLADFGTSKTHVADDSATPSGLKGTVAYMAPEVFLRHEYTPACDVWALGCLILEMMTSENAWSRAPWFNVTKMKQMRELYFIVQLGGVWSKMEEIDCAQPGTPKSNQSTQSPTLPDTLDPIARDFLTRCLDPNPRLRPTCDTLMAHPFLKEDYTPTSKHVDPTKTSASPRTQAPHSDPGNGTTVSGFSGSSEPGSLHSQPPQSPPVPPPAPQPHPQQTPSSAKANKQNNNSSHQPVDSTGVVTAVPPPAKPSGKLGMRKLGAKSVGTGAATKPPTTQQSQNT
eukprot:PhF_6_TR37623/c0_g1_i1/m.55947